MSDQPVTNSLPTQGNTKRINAHTDIQVFEWIKNTLHDNIYNINEIIKHPAP
jgi:hypothetical protein